MRKHLKTIIAIQPLSSVVGEEEVRCGLKELVVSSWGGYAKADHPEENSQEVASCHV